VRTGERSIRFPDVSVYCQPLGPGDEGRQLLGDPQAVVEILSPSTASHDQITKLMEYRALSGVREILFVDPRTERVRLVHRASDEKWSDEWLPVGADVRLDSLNLTIPHEEIFARD
jgi:Uma2 family endonuclease